MIRKIIFALFLLLLTASLFADRMDDRLLKAVRKQDIEDVKYTLEFGANPNCRDENDNTPLMIACQNIWYPGVSTLLKAGANTAAKNQYGQTALIIAAKVDHIDIIQELITRGSVIDAQDTRGKTALMYAVQCGNIGAISLILRSSPFINWKQRNYEGQTVFRLAVETQSIQAVKALLESGVEIDIYEKMPDGCPVLFHAMRHKTPELISYLMDNADPIMLLGLKDSKGRGIEWYISKYRNSAAQQKLEQIKESIQ